MLGRAEAARIKRSVDGEASPSNQTSNHSRRFLSLPLGDEPTCRARRITKWTGYKITWKDTSKPGNDRTGWKSGERGFSPSPELRRAQSLLGRIGLAPGRTGSLGHYLQSKLPGRGFFNTGEKHGTAPQRPVAKSSFR
jgi:hypothetical protein